jgi:aspartyl-tRNA(Asn)/glutamyl-tRNA(Gln) amidotransferase subunit A
MTNLQHLPVSISELQKGLINKDYSAKDLVDSYLSQIEKQNELNAFITVTADEAFKKAEEIDNLLKGSNPEELLSKFPLLGVVVSHKDIFLTEGIKTTAASSVLKDFIAPYSATTVNKLDEAGCIMIGKLNLDAWAHGSSGENSDFGFTKNPWNKEYVPGGSSSGSAVSVAANMSLISTGTDTCGSLRLPANYCGLCALKPTYGVTSRYGVIAMASSLDSVGSMARNVTDLKKTFEVMRGIDGKDSTIVDHAYEEIKESKFKIGIPKEYFSDGLDKEVKESVLKAIDEYKKLGVEFIDINLPNTKYGIDVYYIIQPAEVSSNLGRYDAVRYGDNRESFGDEAKRRIMLGTYVLSAGYYDAYYLKAMKVRSIIIKEINQAFENVDAIIAPVAPTPPFKIGEKVNDPLKMYLTDIFAATANLAGIPSLAIPSGFTVSGLPLGFQLMGPRFSENILFKLGEKYQSVTDWHTKMPQV